QKENQDKLDESIETYDLTSKELSDSSSKESSDSSSIKPLHLSVTNTLNLPDLSKMTNYNIKLEMSIVKEPVVNID
ncbi:24349_t:CDS:2, partial [Dentiscutata erythropus]